MRLDDVPGRSLSRRTAARDRGGHHRQPLASGPGISTRTTRPGAHDRPAALPPTPARVRVTRPRCRRSETRAVRSAASKTGRLSFYLISLTSGRWAVASASKAAALPLGKSLRLGKKSYSDLRRSQQKRSLRSACCDATLGCVRGARAEIHRQAARTRARGQGRRAQGRRPSTLMPSAPHRRCRPTTPQPAPAFSTRTTRSPRIPDLRRRRSPESLQAVCGKPRSVWCSKARWVCASGGRVFGYENVPVDGHLARWTSRAVIREPAAVV
jgi:hypothetical protein